MRLPFLRKLIICTGVVCACASPGWCQQSNPPEKETSGSQAGSSGKTPDQMGSKGSAESPVRQGDGDANKKAKKDKKTKKTDSAKRSSSKS